MGKLVIFPPKLQVTYQGEFTLTLETQLNVDYYVSLLTKIAKQQSPAADAQNSADGVRMKFVPDKTEDDLTDMGDGMDGNAELEGDSFFLYKGRSYRT